MEAEDLSIGDVVGDRFEVVKALGRGGMGVVFLVSDTVLRGPPIVLKMMTSQATADAEEQALFRREVVSTRMVSHPSVVRVFDYHELNGVPAITMEYLPGGTLKERLASKDAATMEQRLLWLAQVADGLQAVHEAQIIHRDLKPQNVLIGQDGRARLTDFGIARAPSSTGRTVPRFTPMYAAPEQIKGHTPTKQTDLYSLGAMSFWCLTGEHVFGDLKGSALMDAHTTNAPRVAHDVNPDVPREASDIIARCLQKDPKKRPATATEVAQAFRAAAEAPPELPPSNTKWFALAGLGVLVVVGGVGFAMLSGGSPEKRETPAVAVVEKPAARPVTTEPAKTEEPDEPTKTESPLTPAPAKKPVVEKAARPVEKKTEKPVEKAPEKAKPAVEERKAEPTPEPAPEPKPVKQEAPPPTPAPSPPVQPANARALAKEEYAQAKSALLSQNTDEAIRLLLLAAQHDPSKPEVHKLLGSAYGIRQERCLARKHFEKFVELAPNDPTAAEVQRRLDSPAFSGCK